MWRVCLRRLALAGGSQEAAGGPWGPRAAARHGRPPVRGVGFPVVEWDDGVGRHKVVLLVVMTKLPCY
jgi:hypothetical protein